MPGPRREPARRIADGWFRLQRGDAGQAVACRAKALPLLPFPSVFHTVRLAHHDVEGTTVDEKECGRHDATILRNHGIHACGRTIADASAKIHHLQRACKVQSAVQGSGAAATTPLCPCGHAKQAASASNGPLDGRS